MAFAGIHVVCAYAGSKSRQRDPAAILGRPIWSKNLTAAGTTADVAPGENVQGQAVFQVYAAADSFVAVGANPNASVEPRVFIPEKTSVTFYVDNGDKLAWVAA